jgi:hypothetical protein
METAGQLDGRTALGPAVSRTGFGAGVLETAHHDAQDAEVVQHFLQ